MIEDLMEISRIISGKIRLDLQDVDLVDIVLSAIESVAAGCGCERRTARES